MGARMRLGVGLAALLAVLVALVLWVNRGDWKVLYASLPDKEAGAIVAQLSQMNVPYKYGEVGGAILVPADRVHEVRMRLATAGLPKAAGAGNELLDNPRLGQTDRQERLMMQRALEGELARTISKLDSVEDARVHLALPNQNGFFREQQKPSASVVLTLHPGLTLERSQIAGIVHLVSSSVPELAAKSVSVIDQRGALLSSSDDGGGKSLDEQQLQYVAQIEGNYLKRVQDILSPVVGAANLRATVTADVDFTQSEATSEQFRPNQGGEPQAIRSQQTSESGGPGSPMPSGVPGAMSNQPPTPASAPINGQAQALQGAQMGGGAGGGASRREATTNFEVDKTVRVTRNAVGTVRRLNAAVVVNHRTNPDPKAKNATAPLSQEELDKLTTLVQEAIGYSKERGDSVKVVNAPFQKEPEAEPVEVPLFKQPWLTDLLRSAVAPTALALVALGLIFGVLRPAIRQLAPPPLPEPAPGTAGAGGAPLLDAVVDDAQELPAGGELPALEAPRTNEKLEAARRLARENPAAVANIMREWVNEEAPR